MKKSILKSLCLGALLAAVTFVAAPAMAIDEEYAVTAISSTTLAGGTNNVAKASTNTYTTAINCTQYDQVGVLIEFKMSAATNTADVVTFTLTSGADTSSYITTGPGTYTLAVTANGTSYARYYTNINVGSLGYLKVASIANTNADDYVTNIAVKVVTKPIREGYRK